MEITESILSLLEQTNPGAFTINRLSSTGMEMLYASPDAAEIVGMEQDEYLAFSRADTLSAVLEADRPIIAAAAERCLRGEGDMDAVYRVRHKTKGCVWIRAKGRIIGTMDGVPIVYAVFYGNPDAEALREAETRALKSQQMYRLIAEQSKLILFEYDQENKRIVYQMDSAYTRAICQAQGMPPVIENVPESLTALVDEPYREQFRALFDPVGGGAPKPAFEYSTVVDGQTHWWRVSSTPVTDSEGRVLTVYCSAQDITEMKREQQRYLDFFQSLDKAYPNNLGSFHLNLSRNICIDGTSPLDFVLRQKESGTVDGYFAEFSRLIADGETLAWFRREFTREALIRSFREGKSTVSFPYSIRYPDGLRWRQAILVMHRNPRTEDVEAVTYAVDIDRQKRGEMILRLMSGEGSDYIGFIDAASGTFAMHSGNWDCVELKSGQRAPYGVCLEHLAGRCASPESGAKLTEQASLEKLSEALKREKKYSILYDFAEDGARPQKKQVVFQWLDETQSEILVIQSDITGIWTEEQERLRRAEEAAVLRDTVSNVPVGIMVISIRDHDFSLVAENDRIQQLLGSGYESRLFFFRQVHPEDIGPLRAALDSGCASRLPVTVEFRFYPEQGGDLRWYRLLANGVERENGERLVYCCLFDITERKAAEAARAEAQRLELQKYETQLNMMASSNPSFAASFHLNITEDLCTNMVVQDEAYAGLKKLAEAGTVAGLFEATAKTIPDPEIAARVRESFNREQLLLRFGQGETKVSMEYPCRSARGGVRWILGSVNMVRNPETGDVEGITYAIDIDDKKKTELVTSRITEQEFEYIGLLYLGSEELELIQKKAHVEYPEVGQKVPYAARRHFVQEHFISPQETDSYTRATDLERIRTELAANGNYTLSYLQTDSAGRRACQQMRFSWLDEAHRIVLIVQTDVTASYEHEEKQIAAIQSALMEAEKACSAKSDFVSRISHDIRTPIGAITNVTAFALEDADDPERLRDDLRKIQVSNEFLLSLVNDVLDISKIDSGKIELHPEPYLYADFVSSLRNMFEPLCGDRGIRFVIDQQPGVPFIYIDHVRLNQIMMNLISNAVKYTPRGGTVAVSAVGSRRPDGQCDCVLTVSDTGIGMSESFQKTMFDPFTQEENNPGREKATQGTGLGLSLVKKLTDLMGGTISVKSELGRGTEISISFVAAEADAAAVSAGRTDEAAPAEPAGALSGTVLLAEDNEINMEIARRILERLGLSVVCAENGARAVELFTASAPGEYCAVLMDIQMPVMNGYDATKAIRELRRSDAKTVPIIAMTADAFTAAIEHSRAVGMSDYVTKPIEPGRLFAALSGAIGRQREAAQE